MADRIDWPAGLPPATQAPVFTPPDSGVLLAAGRHLRRTRTAIVSAGAAAVIAVAGFGVVAVGAQRAGGVDRVTPLTGTTSPTPARPAGTKPAYVKSSQSQGGAAQARPHAGNGPVLSTRGTPRQQTSSDGGGVAAEPGSAVAPATATPFRRTVVSQPRPTSCVYQPSSAPSGWCLDYTGPASAAAGHPVDLSLEICRIAGTGSGTLRFGTAQEADVWVGDTDREWDWAHGRSFAKTPHSVGVPAGQCLRWTTRWTTRDDNGRPLPRGSYTLTVSVDSPDVDLPNSSTVTGTSFDLT